MSNGTGVNYETSYNSLGVRFIHSLFPPSILCNHLVDRQQASSMSLTCQPWALLLKLCTMTYAYHSSSTWHLKGNFACHMCKFSPLYSLLMMYTTLQGPTVYNYTMCTETDGQFFWSGAPWVGVSKLQISYADMGSSISCAARFTLLMLQYALGTHFPYTYISPSKRSQLHAVIQGTLNRPRVFWPYLSTNYYADFIHQLPAWMWDFFAGL